MVHQDNGVSTVTVIRGGPLFVEPSRTYLYFVRVYAPRVRTSGYNRTLIHTLHLHVYVLYTHDTRDSVLQRPFSTSLSSPRDSWHGSHNPSSFFNQSPSSSASGLVSPIVHPSRQPLLIGRGWTTPTGSRDYDRHGLRSWGSSGRSLCVGRSSVGRVPPSLWFRTGSGFVGPRWDKGEWVGCGRRFSTEPIESGTLDSLPFPRPPLCTGHRQEGISRQKL